MKALLFSASAAKFLVLNPLGALFPPLTKLNRRKAAHRAVKTAVSFD